MQERKHFELFAVNCETSIKLKDVNVGKSNGFCGYWSMKIIQILYVMGYADESNIYPNENEFKGYQIDLRWKQTIIWV